MRNGHFLEHLVLACTIDLMNDLGLVSLLEILIFTLRNFRKLLILRYLGICNVLHIWHTRAIPTYRVYRLYDIILPPKCLKTGSFIKILILCCLDSYVIMEDGCIWHIND